MCLSQMIFSCSYIIMHCKFAASSVARFHLLPGELGLMCKSRKLVRGGPTLTTFFLVVEEREDPNTTISVQAIISMPAKCHLNGVLLACQWWPNIESWLGSFVIFQGFWTSTAKKPYYTCILWFFMGGGRFRPLAPLWICSWAMGLLLQMNGMHMMNLMLCWHNLHS